MSAATPPIPGCRLWVFATLRRGQRGNSNDSVRTTSPISGFGGGVSVNYSKHASPISGRGAPSGDDVHADRRHAHARGLGHHGSGRQDGMRSGPTLASSSFAAGRLEELLEEAKQVETLKISRQTDADELTDDTRTRERAARERQERVENAGAGMRRTAEEKQERDKGRKEKSSEASTSTTDPARIIKFSDRRPPRGSTCSLQPTRQTGLVVGGRDQRRQRRRRNVPGCLIS